MNWFSPVLDFSSILEVKEVDDGGKAVVPDGLVLRLKKAEWYVADE